MADPRNGRSPSSDETLDGHAMDGDADTRERLEDRDKSSDDEEKGKDDGPPIPVGFFNKSLNQVRMEVFRLWARTSWWPLNLRIRRIES